MPLDVKDDGPINFPKPDYLPLGNFKRGVITLVNQSNLPKNALTRAQNALLVEDGLIASRPGIDWYGTAPLLAPPGSFTVNTQSGTSLGIGTYQYVVTFVNAQGETQGSTAQSVTTTTGNQDVYVGGFGVDNLPLGPGGATARKIYRTKVGGSTFYFLHQVDDNTTAFYHDTTADASLTVSGLPAANTAAVGSLNGFDYYDSGDGVDLVCVGDGNVFRSINDGNSWALCSGHTFDLTANVNPTQYNGFLYLTCEAQDIMVRYDGSTTLQTYTVLSTPSAPTAAVASGITGTTYTSYYKVSAVSTIGFSIASPKVTVQASKPRGEYSTTNTVTLTLPAYQSTQTRIDIYYSEDDLNYYYLGSQTTPNLTWVDDGSAIIIPSTIAPTTNTTQGPLVAETSVVGNRLYACRDKDYPYRIWFSSGSSPLGSFSNGYDGGYLDWQPGGKYFPVHVEDYRDGKGTNIATVWLDSADSQGGIIQLSLGSLTVGNLSITVPSAYKLPGSRGTPAPRSVVNVLNDYIFYNSQAFYNLGNRPNLLQILSTDETSANIRPTVRTINPTAENGICSIYNDGRVYISVPYGTSATNNATIVYDTELQAWLPQAYTVGFKQFKRYTSADGVHHLLGLKPGDNRLTQIGTLYTPSASIRGDYGVAFETDILTGLYSTTKDRYGFQYTEEMEYEFSNANGTTNIELLGVDHAKGFGSVKAAVYKAGATTSTGWSSFGWDKDAWDDTSVVPTTFSEVSAMRYTVVGRELAAVQWHVFTNTVDAAFTVRSLQTWGTDSEDAHPSKWRIKAT
jgi:hypothetical protein